MEATLIKVSFKDEFPNSGNIKRIDVIIPAKHPYQTCGKNSYTTPKSCHI